MTWEELIQKWKKYDTGNTICLEVAEDDGSLIHFRKDGAVWVETTAYDRDSDECYELDVSIVYHATVKEMDTMVDIIDRRRK